MTDDLVGTSYAEPRPGDNPARIADSGHGALLTLRRAAAGVACALLLWTAASTADAQTTESPDFDDCGTLVSFGNCILFESRGQHYVLGDYGHYKVGDAVRVVGSLQTSCHTICDASDGCISGAVVYDPAVFPCGTQIHTPFDPCSGVSTGFLTASLVGMLVSGRARRR